MDVNAVHSLLAPYGLSAQKYILMFKNFGGSALGMKVIGEKAILPTAPMITMAVTLAEKHLAEAPIEFFTNQFPRGFVVKLSGHDEAFSFDAVRGRHPLIYWDGNNPQAAAAVIAQAIGTATVNTCGLIFQEYFQAPDASEPITFYAYSNKVLAEITRTGARLLVEYRDKKANATVAKTPYATARSNYQPNLPTLLAAVARLRADCGFDFEVEVFGRQGQAPVATQFRPIIREADADVAAKNSIAIKQQLSQRSHLWLPRPWVVGAWRGEAVVGEDTDGKAIFAKRTERFYDDPVLMARLERGQTTLVVDCVDAVRLRFNPCMLPADPALRRSLAYISVVGTPLATISDGQRLSAISDGQFAIIRRKRYAH